MNGCFVLLSYVGPALDGTIVQRSNLVHLESDVGAIEWVWFCICMSVYLSLREQRESCTFMKLQCILSMLHILYILCHIMLFGVILCLSSNFGKDISITYQNSPKSVFYLFLWVQAFGLYNLILCYSLQPVLAIWHVTLIIFLQIEV